MDSPSGEQPERKPEAKPEQDNNGGFLFTGTALRETVHPLTPEKIVNEKPAAQAQHEREEAKAAAEYEREQKRSAAELDRKKEFIRFVVSLVVLGLVGPAALYVALTAQTVEGARWAGGLVGAILTAALSNFGKK